MGAPAVLVLDDGELDDVQQLLQEMAIPFARDPRRRDRAGLGAAARPADRHAAPDRRGARRGRRGDRRAGPRDGGERGLERAALAAAPQRLRLPRAATRARRGAPTHAAPLLLQGRGAPPRAARAGGRRSLVQPGSGRAPRDAGRPVEPRLPAAVAPSRRARQAHQGADSRGARRGRGRRAALRAGARDPRRGHRERRDRVLPDRRRRSRSSTEAPGARSR